MSKHHFRTWQNCKKLSLRVDILNEAFYKKMSLFFNIQSSPLLLKHIFITFLPRGGMNLIFFFFFFGGGGGGSNGDTGMSSKKVSGTIYKKVSGLRSGE